MLQAHSFLWHYLWLAPNVLSLILAARIWRRGLHRRFPLFFCYLIFVAFEELCLYALDLSPTISAITWWRVFWGGTIIEGLLKFAVVAELVHRLLHSWPAVARLGRNLVSGAGVVLVLVAALAAAFAAPDNAPRLVGGAHILLQTLYIAQAGLILSIFVLATCLRIPWDTIAFAIALGLGFVWCEHLAIWALIAGGLVRNRDWVDLANMATYHVCVLIWFYYLLVPKKPAASSAVPLPENNLEVWNRELERLVQP
jgi:hypothetical protein